MSIYIPSQEVKALRIRSGLTQFSAAELIGVDEHTWQQWELGTRKMKIPFWELFILKFHFNGLNILEELNV